MNRRRAKHGKSRPSSTYGTVLLSVQLAFGIAGHVVTAANAPSTFALISGAYEVEITPTYAYTITGIAFEGVQLGDRTGFYGTVIAPQPGKYIGSGHKEGGAERVEAIMLDVDGETTIPLAGRSYHGQCLRLTKLARLDQLRFEVVIELSVDGIKENKRYEALGDQPIHQFAVYAYCWNVSTTEWIARLPDGETREGTFRNDNGWQLKADPKWAAVYDPGTKKGILMLHPEIIPGMGVRSAFWDVPRRYHKYDVFPKVTNPIPKGEKSGWYRLTIKGFSADEAAWKETATAVAAPGR